MDAGIASLPLVVALRVSSPMRMPVTSAAKRHPCSPRRTTAPASSLSLCAPRSISPRNSTSSWTRRSLRRRFCRRGSSIRRAVVVEFRRGRSSPSSLSFFFSSATRAGAGEVDAVPVVCRLSSRRADSAEAAAAADGVVVAGVEAVAAGAVAEEAGSEDLVVVADSEVAVAAPAGSGGLRL